MSAGKVARTILVYWLAGVLVAACVGLVGGMLAWKWLVPSLGLSGAILLVRVVSVTAGILCTAIFVGLAVRKVIKSVSPHQKELPAVSRLDDATPKSGSTRYGKMGQKVLCCLMAFLLSFSLLGDGLAAYADELRGGEGASESRVAEGEKPPAADGREELSPEPADAAEELGGAAGDSAEEGPAAAEPSASGGPGADARDGDAPASPGDAGAAVGEGAQAPGDGGAAEAEDGDADVEADAPDPCAILNAPADYYDEPEPEGELVSAGDGATVYRLSDTEYRTVIGGAATAYVDEEGEARPIDNTLVPVDEPDGPLEFAASLFAGDGAAGDAAGDGAVALYLGEGDEPGADGAEVDPSTVYAPKSGEGSLAIPAAMGEEGMAIEKDGHRVRLVPEGGEFTASVAEGNAIRYTEVLPGVDYQYTLVGSLVKEDIVLTRPVEPFPMRTRIEADDDLEVSLEGGTVVVRERTEGGQPGREVLSLAAPIAADAAEAVDNTLSLSLEEAEDGAPVAVVNANWEWLSAPERAYPVRIDPTIDIATTAMRLTSVEQLAPNIWVDENNYQYAGYDDGDATGTGDYRGGEGLGMTRVYLDINYDFGNIMDEALIKRAELRLHQRNVIGRSTVSLAYRNKGDWDFKEITWNSQKSMGHEFITSQNARSSKGYLSWDVREPVNKILASFFLISNFLSYKTLQRAHGVCEIARTALFQVGVSVVGTVLLILLISLFFLPLGSISKCSLIEHILSVLFLAFLFWVVICGMGFSFACSDKIWDCWEKRSGRNMKKRNKDLGNPKIVRDTSSNLDSSNMASASTLASSLGRFFLLCGVCIVLATTTFLLLGAWVACTNTGGASVVMAADFFDETTDSENAQSGDSEAQEEKLVIFYDSERVCVEECCVNEDGSVSFRRGAYEWIRREDLKFVTVYGRIFPR